MITLSLHDRRRVPLVAQIRKKERIAVYKINDSGSKGLIKGVSGSEAMEEINRGTS